VNFKKSDVLDVISEFKNGKAPGPDGIRYEFLRAVARNEKKEKFIRALVNLFNKLINKPEEIVNVISMYYFTVILIPKKDGGLRPISKQCALLNTFHNCINKKLPLPSFPG
jgi:hypothetical protein